MQNFSKIKLKNFSKIMLKLSSQKYSGAYLPTIAYRPHLSTILKIKETWASVQYTNFLYSTFDNHPYMPHHIKRRTDVRLKSLKVLGAKVRV